MLQWETGKEQREYSGRLIESLLLANEVVANKQKMEQLLLNDPFVWAPACHQMYKR